MTIVERARALRRAIEERAAVKLTDADASVMAELFPRLKGDGSLITAGTRINHGGRVLRAANDLWDTAENTPDRAPVLWEEIGYREGIRVIPAVITAGAAFAEGEVGWWGDQKYRSRMPANVFTPEGYPEGWEAV